MDASSNWVNEQFRTVEEVLGTLEASEIARILVFNKADLVKDPFIRKKISLAYPDALFVSAFNKEDMGLLKKRIGEVVKKFDREKQMSEISAGKTRSIIGKA